MLKSSGNPEGEVAREPEKKKMQVQTNRQELTARLRKGKIRGRKSKIFN